MDDPEVEFEAKSRYDHALVWMNEWLGIVFVFNDLMKQSGDPLSKKEQAELDDTQAGIMVKVRSFPPPVTQRWSCSMALPTQPQRNSRGSGNAEARPMCQARDRGVGRGHGAHDGLGVHWGR